jgi:cyclic di-GMP phosphodiesterase
VKAHGSRSTGKERGEHASNAPRLDELADAVAAGAGGAAFAASQAVRLSGVVAAAAYVRDGDGLACAATRGATSALDPIPSIAHDALRDQAKREGEGADGRRALAIPLASDTQAAFAVLVVVVERAIDDALAGDLEEIAHLAAALLRNEERLLASAREARQDPLTGLRNRRAFDEQLESLLRSAAASELAVVFCDLDDFKSINDHHGYDAGDEVLREVARALASELRPGEELFRIGGDEFAAIVLGGRAVGAVVATRLAQTLGRRRRGRPLPSLSTGIALYPEDGETPLALVAAGARGLASVRRADRSQLEASGPRRLRLLAVDDDASLRLLLRTTFELADISVEEAETAEEARAAIARSAPDVVVLDVTLPGTDGLELTRVLKTDSTTRSIPVVLLTGGAVPQEAARAAGADALVRKPFSPLELLAIVERVAGAGATVHALGSARRGRSEDQLLLYAGDLRRVLEVERRQRRELENAYRETLGALASALEMRDTGTAEHSLRVQRYAIDLAAVIAPELLGDSSVEYGFLLHDVGKIGIPDSILRKAGPLTTNERAIMETHAPVGAQILAEVGQLRGEGIAIVRHHHERWDGSGYPDRLVGESIPLGARIFAVADTLDAMTSERPYRSARPWHEAVAEIRRESGHQFDPVVVQAFAQREPYLRNIHGGFVAA